MGKYIYNKTEVKKESKTFDAIGIDSANVVVFFYSFSVVGKIDSYSFR